jgi:hypothetical protein
VSSVYSTGIRSPVYIYAAMDGAPTTKAERVRREKEGLHGYETTPVYPSIPLSSGIAPSPVSGLVHEDDVPRDEPSNPSSSGIAPSPVSGVVHEDDVPRDEPSIPSSSGRAPSPVSGLVHEDGPRDEAASGLVDDAPASSGLRYPFPLILSFLSPAERVVHLEVSIACWQEVSIYLEILRTKDRIVTRDWTDVVRRSRPSLFGPNFPPSCVRIF